MKHPKIPKGKNYKHYPSQQIGNLRIGKTLYGAGDWNTTHSHENPRFVFVLHKNFAEKYDGKERFCKPFTGIFRPALEKHSEVYEEGVVCISVNLAPSWLKKLEDYSVKLDESYAFRNQKLGFLMTNIADELELNDDVSDFAIDTLLKEVAIEMYRDFSKPKKDKNPIWLKTAVEYIHENFADSISIDEIAFICGVHPVHLSRVFRNYHRCTISEYIRNLRIEKAQKLLLNSDLSIAQIATQTGFADQSHFTKNFKRLTYTTPAQFRKNSRLG